MFNNRAEAKQRFSLRKLTVGVVSVLLGLTFLTYHGENVHADTNSASAQPKTEEVSSSSNKGDIVEKSTTASTIANQVKASVESANVETKDAVQKAEVKSSTPQAASKVSAAQDVNKTDDKNNNIPQQGKTGEKENISFGNTTGIYIGDKAYQKGQQIITKAADEDAQQLTANAEANYAKLPSALKKDPASYEVFLNKPIPKEIVANYFGLNKPDISEAQLTKLGLAKDTFFIHDANGKTEKVKLGKTDLIILSWDGRQKFQFEVPAIHDDKGFFHFFEPDPKIGFDPVIDQGYYIGDSFQIVESGPITEGKHIYTNVNHTLDSNDANRAIINGQPDAYGNGSHWITDFDNTKAGDYEGHFEAFYKNGVGILTGVPVTVVDLQGKTVIGTFGKDIDEKVAKIIQNPAKYINGIPTGSTSVTLLEDPSRTQSSNVDAVVVYPDGNSGKATIHVIVKVPAPVQPTSPTQLTKPTSPTQPTNQPSQPTSQPSQPTNVPPHPENPTKPVEPTKPNQPSNVRPKPVKPVRPAKPQSSNVKPKPETPSKSRTTKPIAQKSNKNSRTYGYCHAPQAASSKSYSGVSNASALKACNKVLPHTGSKGNGVIAAIGAAFAAVAGFFGLAGRRRRRF